MRSDWHGQEVGLFLLSRLIEAARQAEIHELFGLVLRENKSMFDMCHDLGFGIAREPMTPP